MNYIDLSILPKTGKGIDWKSVNNIEVDFEYEGIKDKLLIIGKNNTLNKIDVEYNGYKTSLNYTNMYKGMLRPLINPEYGEFIYNVGDHIETRFSTLEILKVIGKSPKKYLVKCLTCGNIFQMIEWNIKKGDSCPVCARGRIVKGINDMCTTNPEMASHLFNYEDGYTHSDIYQGKLQWVCPDCGKVFTRSPLYIQTYGLKCPYCSDNISYPNKFMADILEQLEILYETEVLFDWCVFKHPQSDQDTYGFYDFVIESQKIIIEMDGGLGHGFSKHSGSKESLEDQLYRDAKKNELAEQNGYQVIRIDAKYTGNQDRFEYCKSSVIKSLRNIFDLSAINWESANLNACSNLLKEICLGYNSGLTIKTLVEKYHKSRGCIYNYLKIGASLGICNYSTNNWKKNLSSVSKNRSAKPFICEETGYYFHDTVIAIDIFKSLLDTNLNQSNLCTALRSGKAYKGYHWRRITKQDFNSYKIKHPELTFGDFFTLNDNNQPSPTYKKKDGG